MRPGLRNFSHAFAIAGLLALTACSTQGATGNPTGTTSPTPFGNEALDSALECTVFIGPTRLPLFKADSLEQVLTMTAEASFATPGPFVFEKWSEPWPLSEPSLEGITPSLAVQSTYLVFTKEGHKGVGALNVIRTGPSTWASSPSPLSCGP